MFKYILIFFIFITSTYSSQKHNYLLEHYKKNEVYNKDTRKLYKQFLNAYQSSSKDYKSNISKYWKKVLLTSNYLFVQYSPCSKKFTHLVIVRNMILTRSSPCVDVGL